MSFYLTYTTPELFGVKEFLTVSGGWENPYDIFAQQAESKLFRNNAIISARESVPAAWAGHRDMRPGADT